MFDLFKADPRKALREEIARRHKLLANAMKRHGVNSWQVKDFDKQLDELEAQLKAA